MSIAFHRGKQLGSEDLNIFLESNAGHPQNAAEISYALYDFTTGAEVLVGAPRRTPVNPSVGSYYASLVIPLDANLGSYRIRWTFREMFGGPIHQVVQEFEVVDQQILAPITDGCMTELIRSIRILTRDNNPDRNYHFRPPAHETTINQFNQVFGFIWENEELEEYLNRGLDMVIAAPPRTPFQNVTDLCRTYPEWRTLLINAGMLNALFALQLNWISEEFSYSVGGISLDLERSSKYESAYGTLKDTWESQLERAKQTVKFIRGIQQPKYGIGVRSSFGPYTGRGVISPRKFMGF